MAVAARYPAALIVVLLLLLPVTTNATENIPPPGEIRFIKKHGATSDCIGDTNTPLCALETELDRFLRSAGHFCAQYDAPGIMRDPFGGFGSFALTGRGCVVVPRTLEYVVAKYEEVSDDTRERLKKEELESLQGLPKELQDDLAGSVPPVGSVIVELGLRSHGQYGMIWPPEGWRKQSYTLRRHGKRWAVRSAGSSTWVRRIGDSRSSSKCIGNPVTPLCAVETYFACRTRADLKLCMIADETYERTYEPLDGTVAFQVFSMRPVEALGLQRRKNPTVFVWLEEWFEFPDYSQWPACGDGVQPPCPRALTTGYAVQKTNGRWRVIDRVVLADEEEWQPREGFTVEPE